jgi:adenosylcobinamide kinase/adenosylcobinamide-phosphate guanylyltransferase
VHELILGGVRSGKSAAALARAQAWLAAAGREATFIATAVAGDGAMRRRIEAHARERALRLPAMATVEAPLALPEAIVRHALPQRLLVVDCLTLWLANLRAPLSGAPLADTAFEARVQALLDALAEASGPAVLVSNEIGLGVLPADTLSRRYVDDLGRLHQRVAARCVRVTLMVAGVEVPVKAPNRTPAA